MSFLKFLKEVNIEEVAAKEKKAVGGPRKLRNPEETFFGIRIWKDGSVYPSKALVDAFDLEYKEAIVTIEGEGETAKRNLTFANGVGNALDVIDTRDWAQYKHDQHCILVAVTAKNQPKVNLFGSTKYEESGAPVASVLDQGAATFGSEVLLPLIKDLYNVEPNEEGYIDLLIDTNVNLRVLSPSGNFFFPKVVSRGADKGKVDYQRRENVDIFGMVPAVLLEETKEVTLQEEGNLPTQIATDDVDPVVVVENADEPSAEVATEEPKKSKKSKEA